MASHESIRKRGNGGASARGSLETSSGETGGGETYGQIPDKLYFRIGEVARLCDIPTYVLRFWEGEFPQLKINKGGTGQRLYRRRDVETALRIKSLLYSEGYTIPGARQALKIEVRSGKDRQLALGMGEPQPTQVDAKHLKSLQKDLRELHALLSWPVNGRSTKQTVQPIRGAATAERTRRPRPLPEPIPIAMADDLPFDGLEEGPPIHD